jgi:hypothetical protein
MARNVTRPCLKIVQGVEFLGLSTKQHRIIDLYFFVTFGTILLFQTQKAAT